MKSLLGKADGKLFFCFNKDDDLEIIHAQCGHKASIQEVGDRIQLFCPLHQKRILNVKKTVLNSLKVKLKNLPVGKKIRVKESKEIFFSHWFKDEKNILCSEEKELMIFQKKKF